MKKKKSVIHPNIIPGVGNMIFGAKNGINQ